MKLKRYYIHNRLHNVNDGDVCMSYDVEKLEASHAELLAAAKDMLAWWDHRRPNESAQDYINRLRNAVAKAERGEDAITDDEGEL